jgi:methylated-DNA-[protein]-cysteine S-methyltransferase
MKPLPIHSAEIAVTPVGTLRLWATPLGLRRVEFELDWDPKRGVGDVLPAGRVASTAGAEPRIHADFGSGAPNTPIALAVQQLEAYFAGKLDRFDVPLDLDGSLTPFQKRVYERLKGIPFGQIVTYGKLAEEIGETAAGSARAVGHAVSANPVPIVIPCHRVVGADGRLTGFSGGLTRKATLLALEGIDVRGALASSRVHPEVLRLPL